MYKTIDDFYIGLEGAKKIGELLMTNTTLIELNLFRDDKIEKMK